MNVKLSVNRVCILVSMAGVADGLFSVKQVCFLFRQFFVFSIILIRVDQGFPKLLFSFCLFFVS